MTERKEFNDERAAMANDIRDEQTYLASCRERLSEYDVPRRDRLQRVIDYFDRAASPQATATQPAQTERALTVTPAMVKAAMPWLTGLNHMRRADKESHVEEAIKAALVSAQQASGGNRE
jgi:hypothetical protein